ncbi:DegT/DnrJ/EryC1/StrS family aminotransferase [Methylotetracoccus oryzae]|uniref:DegT/DnrJ/EryC1/StrS family aminotransferase n=1 Tax=Methylotetracoccus oryzae TaxID=1919059 RepID=UPI0011191224|nr:DegT/DnrJ/EryC1/StrS family aminotransferase [Methylotetracoccus oryzae]
MIPVNEPLLDGNEKKYLAECIDTGWISSEGPFVERFETEFAARIGRKHGIAVCNGTAAIDAAVEALGIGPGDEVILPTFTIISCVLQIVRSGAKPVFVDADPRTWNMDVTQIECKITSRTKAIMVVHIYGLPVDMDPVLELAERYELKIIEDAAEAIGQTYRGRPCGSFGEISTFSFYPNKHITTGEGGMILTDDDDIAEACRSLRNLCFQPDRRFFHERLGWNLRMTNLQAAVGLAQLERLDEFLERKRSMGKLYTAALCDLDSLVLPLMRTEFAENLYWVYAVVISESSPLSVDHVRSELASYGVGTRPAFFPLHAQPVLASDGMTVKGEYKVSEYLCDRCFYLPSGLALTSEKIEHVADRLREIIER